MINCPICGNQVGEFQPSFIPGYLKCKICSGCFISGRIETSYPQEYFENSQKSSLIARLAAPLLNFFYYLRVRRIKSILAGNHSPKILDYGCGAGKLVEALIKNGIDAVGFEPSEEAGRIAARKNLPVYSEINPVESGYNLIMFWHSLEHTEKPLEILKSIKNYLAENGRILIAVPNADSFEARIGKEKWFHRVYPLHKIQFTPKSLETMLDLAAFKIIRKDFYNPEYTISGLVQTFLNLFLPPDVLYNVIGRERLSIPVYKAVFLSFLSLFLLLIFAPALLGFFLIQLILSKTGAMVIIAKKHAV